MLVNTVGEHEETSCFQRGDNTDAKQAITIRWQDQVYIFGGMTKKRQISRLNGYQLERVGDLDFDLQYGTGSNMYNQFIFLCFNADSRGQENDYKRCWRSTGPLETFSEVALANNDHRFAQTSCTESKYPCLITKS